MRTERRMRAALFACVAGSIAAGAAADGRELRVCSDPNNLPFSNEAREGFENVLAELLAGELGASLSYVWWAQRRGFIRNTLDAGDCDVVMGVPAHYELVATTRPYYRSAYVLVQPANLSPPLHALTDPRLRALTIGVHLTGDDGANPPPAHALGQLGIVDNVVGYTIYGDYRQPNPPARLIEAVSRGDVDVAAVWGPTGAYFAARAEPPLVVAPLTDSAAFARLPFEFDIAIGVRKNELAFRDEIERALDARRADVRRVLLDYGVPLVERATSQRNAEER